MGTLERTEIVTAPLGKAGRVAIKSIGGHLSVRGIEGEEARVTISYRIRATDQLAAEHALDTGRVLVDRAAGKLRIETPERRLSTGLAWLLGGCRVSADISAEVPWGTEVKLETMGGSVDAASLTGEQKYRTVSGEIRLHSLAGPVDAGTLSGPITLDRGGEIWLRANTVSGQIRADAVLFRGLALSTTSGGIQIAGHLDPKGTFRADSISGGVDVTAMSGVRVELRSISGGVQPGRGARVGGYRGNWQATVGDGRALLAVHTTSGGLRLTESVPAPAPATAPLPESAPAAPPADSEAWSPEEESGEETAKEERENDQLEILAALERGEIGVDEASALLERHEA